MRSAAPELQSAGLSEEGEPLLEPSDRGRLSVKGGILTSVFSTPPGT